MDERDDRVDDHGSFNTQLTGQFRGLFRTLVDRCSRILRDRDLAEDVAQEALVRAWRHRGRFQPGRSLAAWVNTIGTRACLDAHRERARRSGHPIAAGVETAEASDPSDLVDEAEDRNAVWRALVRLCPRHRFVLIRHYLEDAPYDAVAEEMGTSVETTYALSLRARKAFESNYRAPMPPANEPAAETTDGRDDIAVSPVRSVPRA